jgi:hypothetical protein
MVVLRGGNAGLRVGRRACPAHRAPADRPGVLSVGCFQWPGHWQHPNPSCIKTSKFADWTRSSELKFTRTCHCQYQRRCNCHCPPGLPGRLREREREAASSIRVTIMIRFIRMALPAVTGMGPSASKVPAERQCPTAPGRAPPSPPMSSPLLRDQRPGPRMPPSDPEANGKRGHNLANRGL